MKRAFDIAVASLALVVLALPMLVIAAIVRWRMGSPVLFRQIRPGLHGKPFVLLKFRSMRHTTAGEESVSDADRLTGFGRVLRSSSLDELPELWNVLVGDMSLVGPRPLLMEYLPLYSPEQARRHEIRPGLTGWAQVNGRNAIEWDQKFALDVWYVDNHSFLLDMRILWKTLMAVLSRHGIDYDKGGVGMAPFSGSGRPPA